MGCQYLGCHGERGKGEDGLNSIEGRQGRDGPLSDGSYEDNGSFQKSKYYTPSNNGKSGLRIGDIEEPKRKKKRVNNNKPPSDRSTDYQMTRGSTAMQSSSMTTMSADAN